MRDRSFEREILPGAIQFSKEKDYWINKLSGDLVVSCFPCDYYKTGRYDDKAGGHKIKTSNVKFRIEGELLNSLIKISGNSDSRLFVLLVMGLMLLLYKYTGHEDIIIGVPIDNQDIKGEYINTILALRSQVSTHMTIKEFLYQVRQTIVEACENQNYPLETIHYELNIPVSENDDFPLFDLAILLQNIHDKSYINHLKLNMIFSFSRTGEGLEGEVEYNPLLYKHEDIERIISHLIHLLHNAFDNTGISIADLEILTEREKKHLLLEMNDTKVEYPEERTIHELFEMQVEKTPCNIAVEEADTGRFLSYKGLNESANQLSALLRERGSAQGMIAAIMGERKLEIVIGILAILKGGEVYLPIDAQNPDERLKFILSDSGAHIFLSQKHIIDQCPGLFQEFSPGKVITLDDRNNYKGKAENPRVGTRSTDPAYIIYTSGTTGKPKGVMIEHKSLVNYINFAVKNYVKGEAVNFPLYSSIGFDLTVTSIFTPLVTGNGIVIYSGWGKGNLIERIVDDNKVEIVKLTPSHLYLIKDKKIGKKISGIKRFIVGGEALNSQLARHIHDNFKGNIEIYNEYGPTEATVGCMLYKYNPQKDNMRTVPIGVPADNTQIYLLDKNLKPVPEGAIGELYVSGIGVASGYLNRPELTAEKFVNYKLQIPNYKQITNPKSQITNKDVPFGHILKVFGEATNDQCPMTNDRLYRTGDLGRWLPDGNIEFLGRIDQQVKIRGFRIELGEIENQLMQHDDIKKAVVIIRDADGGNVYGGKRNDKSLCAYIVTTKELTASHLREFLSSKLPDYMVPSYFVPLDAIPLTPNGKVDLRSLPEPKIKLEVEFVSPRNETEKKLVVIWSEILGVDAGIIGIDSNFFELGGHSLSGTVLSAKIHKAFNVKLLLVDLFRLPTVRELAQLLEKLLKTEYTSIEPVEKKEYYPLSSAQERLFIIKQMDQDGIGYNVPMVYEIEGSAIREELQEVFRELIRRHENLRTTFILINDKLVQWIHKQSEFEIEYFDLTGVEHTSLRDTEIQLIISGFIRPFDFSHAPLLRVGLMCTDRSSHRHILMMDIHHIITDGVSMDILIKEIGALYTGQRLSPLKLHYRDFSEWQNSEKVKKEMKKQEAYWSKQFEGEIHVLELTIDFPIPAFQNFEGNLDLRT